MIWEIDGKKVEFNNPDKVFWPKEKLTKKDLADYYYQVAYYILPYLKDRPQSMNRFPNGITGENFYHKNIGEVGPDWLKRQPIYSPSNEITEQYLLCQDLPTLIYMVNLGCIELNPWSSRAQHLEKPDWAIIDLDPEDIGFKEVVRVAELTHQVLKKAGIMGYLKTSGATGMHIYIPYKPLYTYEQIKNISHLIAIIVHRELPEITSLERLPKNRQKKIYLDFLQNNMGQTLAAPYSVRPRPGASVSTPLLWGELEKDFMPADFNLKNINERLKKVGDIFAPVLKDQNNFKENLKSLEKLL